MPSKVVKHFGMVIFDDDLITTSKIEENMQKSLT